jgi:hypothetical protein
MINTQITSIRPYRLHNQWVFDSDRHGLIEEAFVCGMTEIIDEVLHDNDIDPDTVADKGFRLTFSAKPWPESTHCLKWDREEYDGNVYYATLNDGEQMQGWLCPALFRFFEDAPKEIHCSVEEF